MNRFSILRRNIAEMKGAIEEQGRPPILRAREILGEVGAIWEFAKDIKEFSDSLFFADEEPSVDDLKELRRQADRIAKYAQSIVRRTDTYLRRIT